jgi:SNF2 family DNA or RNA helicase
MHQYQVVATDHVIQHPQSMLWQDCGLGKTICTLTAIVELMDRMQIHGVLVLAPLRVCQAVWEQEAAKWEHTQHLTFSSITGSASRREWNLMRKANIYLLNYDNVRWAVEKYDQHFNVPGRDLPFDMLVFDEVSKLKNSTAKRHLALRRMLPAVPRRVGLTGTPACNGYKDLHGQYLAVDDGARLGDNITFFRDEYMHKSHSGHGYDLNDSAEKRIQTYIGDITLQMSAKGLLDLPDVTVNDIWLDMPPAAMAKYKELETDMFVQMDDGAQIEVFNAAALTGKCLQAANGALYIEPGEPGYSIMHDTKLDALDDVIEEAAGSPVLILYAYKHDKERILQRHPDARSFKSGMSKKAMEQLMDDWNAGRITKLLGHPASMGHGLNLQEGGHIAVWYGLNWSLELYEQANARLDRQGQTHPVIQHRLLCKGTMDEGVADALDGKKATQAELRQAIFDYRNNVLTM